MAIENLGITQIRKPDYTEPRWDVPLNENWEAVAALLETLNTGSRWVSGLGLSQDGGLNFTIASGIINRGGVDENIAGASSSVGDGTTSYIYVDNVGGLVVSNTFEATNILPLYMVQASGGAIVSVGDLRHYQVASGGGGGGGGLEWQTETGINFTAENGKGYPMFNGNTMTLPAIPSDNMQIGWKDFNNNFDQIPCYIDPAGNNIEQLGSGIMELDTRGQGGTLVWITDRWLIVDVTELGDSSYGIMSIQRFTGVVSSVASPLDVPITPVDPNQTFLLKRYMGDSDRAGRQHMIRLKDASTVEVINLDSDDTTYSFEVVEYKSGLKVQRFNGTTDNSSGPFVIPIETVDMNRSFTTLLNQAVMDSSSYWLYLSLNAPNEVTFEFVVREAFTYSIEVVEFL